MTYKAQGATWGQGCEPVLADSSLFRKIESYGGVIALAASCHSWPGDAASVIATHKGSIFGSHRLN